MQKVCWSLLLAVIFILNMPIAMAAFPNKPIKLIVYTKPGGAIDVFARKFQATAKKYTNANFVIVNKPGAGGIIALKHILSRPNDGYTLAVVTKSNIGKIVFSQNASLKIDSFDWLSMMVSDPEAIIVNKKSPINTWKILLADAIAKPGQQIWVGPAVGGNDHIMALKTWKKAGMSAKWIPYAGGGKAMTALMGKHGVAYVGNPGDVIGKPDLKVIAIASEKRLKGEFADVPTFSELGVPGLEKEIMWRGFMGKKGFPTEVASFYNDLFTKINADTQWRDFITSQGATPMYLPQSEFSTIVNADHLDFTSILRDLGVIK